MRPSRARLRSFWVPFGVLITTWSPSRSIHTIVACGEPFFISVAKIARFGPSRSCCTSSGRLAMTYLPSLRLRFVLAPVSRQAFVIQHDHVDAELPQRRLDHAPVTYDDDAEHRGVD